MAVELISRELFYLLSIAFLWLGIFQGYVIIALLIRIFAFGVIFKLTMNRLKEKNLFLLSFVYDLLWPFLGAYLIVTNKLRKKPTKWK